MTALPINWPKSGRYIVAVSGGADSVTLLDLLALSLQHSYDLIVAHYDHGMRSDSLSDMNFVRELAASYDLPFTSTSAILTGTSEATARQARYIWLKETLKYKNADAIITAHHRDDLIETSLLHLARGTGRHGLAPMNTRLILRPLLRVSRVQLRQYAKNRTLVWHEDETNKDIANPRNFIRHNLLPNAKPSWHASYLGNINKMLKLNKKIDQKLNMMLRVYKVDQNSYSIPRTLVQDLSILETEELLVATALALDPSIELDHRVVSEVALFAKTGRPGTKRPLRKHLSIGVQTDNVRVYYYEYLR